MLDDFLKTVEEKMNKAKDSIYHKLQGLRTSRATPTLLDRIKVECYGGQILTINQIASISIPESRTILIQPWDKNITSDIEKAILKSDLGITPQISGGIIRLNIPPLTEERRKEIVKIAKKDAETGKVAVRSIRRDTNEEVKKQEKDKKISEDESEKLQEKVQKLTDKYIEEIDKILQAKEKEIMGI